MKILCLTFLITVILAVGVFSQTMDLDQHYTVFDGKGNQSSLVAIVKALDGADAIFLGEQHDDSVGHSLEFEIFKQAVAEYSTRRKVALSMEMFERDVQIVVDEYLSGQITEAQFLASSRPWGNYKTDYRPLVELAKDKKLPLIAANAPRRYVNMVSRGGRDTLNGLSKEAKSWLAPLPYGEPSDTYAKKFKALMGPSPEAQMGIDKILASQSLWDATMGNSVANYLKKNKQALVVHLNGSFHTESHLGTADHLIRYRPKARVLVVTIRYEDDFKTFNKAKDTDLGDFVILTDSKQPRSKR
jgi:uncharacterized iron-regulated protein